MKHYHNPGVQGHKLFTDVKTDVRCAMTAEVILAQSTRLSAVRVDM